MSELQRDTTGSYVHPDDPGEPTTDTPRLSITDLEADLLAALVVDRDVVEIGTGLGVSTRALARTARQVVTVDVDPWVQDTIWPDLPANVIPSPVIPVGRWFSGAFIDGDHNTTAVARDIAAVLPIVRSGGLIVAHDTNYHNVRDGLPDGFMYVPTEHGLGIYWKTNRA